MPMVRTRPQFLPIGPSISSLSGGIVRVAAGPLGHQGQDAVVADALRALWGSRTRVLDPFETLQTHSTRPQLPRWEGSASPWRMRLSRAGSTTRRCWVDQQGPPATRFSMPGPVMRRRLPGWSLDAWSSRGDPPDSDASPDRARSLNPP